MTGLPAWAGTLPGWITALCSGGLLVAFLRFLPDWTRARAAARKIVLDADAALRADLLGRIAKLEKDAVDKHVEHAKEIRACHNMIDGLRRQLIASQIAMAQALPLGKRTPEVEAMIERVMTHVDRLNGEAEERDR